MTGDCQIQVKPGFIMNHHCQVQIEPKCVCAPLYVHHYLLAVLMLRRY